MEMPTSQSGGLPRWCGVLAGCTASLCVTTFRKNWVRFRQIVWALLILGADVESLIAEIAPKEYL